MITHTVTWLELLWTIAAIVGFMFDLALLNRSIVDYLLLKAVGKNGGRQYSAKTGIFVFIGGLVIQASYIFLGAVAMYYPNPPERTSTVSYVVGGIVFGSSIIATIFAGIIYHRRTRLVEMYEKESIGDAIRA